MRMFRIIEGDALERLAALPAESFDGCLCDPPYGLSDPRPANSATPRQSSRERIRAGFMGMQWDSKVPGPETWAALLRVLKPGAMLLAFGGSRTHHRLMCAIEDGGFEIRDCMMWLYGSGFPKSMNIGKSMGGEWAGYGTALKPAWEPIIVAMRPCDGTFAANALKWGVAGINVDAGRIGAIDLGRWPANVVLDEESAMLLDEQSGQLTSGANPERRGSDKFRNTFSAFEGERECTPARGADSGGASRFFYIAKADGSQRINNTHPTVKPIDLCAYLAKLILPPEREGPRRIITPFSGSGSEIIGALRAGWDDATGVEISAEYAAISRNRIQNDAPMFNVEASA